MDMQIGRLLNHLSDAGLLDDAAVVVVGDHGEGLGQHDWVGHGRLHDEITRVPLRLKLPGMTPEDGRSTDRLTALVDVLPTLVEELALPIPQAVRDQFEGMNALRDEPWDYVLTERTHGRLEKVGPGLQFTLTGTRWKYFHATEHVD